MTAVMFVSLGAHASAQSAASGRPAVNLFRTRVGPLRSYPMPTVRLFALSRELAGTGRLVVAGETVGDVIDNAIDAVGPGLGSIVAVSRIWVNGEESTLESPVGELDEVAIIPPVSGGT